MPGAINPFLRLGVNINPAVLPGLNLGKDAASDWSVKSQLIFSCIALWVFASIMKSLALRIPQIAESIAAAPSGISFQPSPVTKLVKGGEYQKFDLGKYEGFNPDAK